MARAAERPRQVLEAQGFVERGGLTQHGGGLQVAALIAERARLVQRLQHQPSPQSQPAQGGHEVHLLQLADLPLFPRQRRYAAPAENGAVRPLDHPVAAALTQVGFMKKVEIGIRYAVALVGGEAVFGGDGAHHGSDGRVIGRGDGANAIALLATGAGEGAAIEAQAFPQLLALGEGELGQGLLHGAVHLLMQVQQLGLAGDGEARLLAATIGRMGMPADELALGQAGQRAAGVGLVDAQALRQLLIGGGAALQLDQQMGFERAERQFATLLGEHAEFANQIARQGAQGAGIHIRASYLVVINNQYSQLVVTSNFFIGSARDHGTGGHDERAQKRAREGPKHWKPARERGSHPWSGKVPASVRPARPAWCRHRAPGRRPVSPWRGSPGWR